MRVGVEEALGRLRPDFGDFAVVYDERNWHPVNPPGEFCWDYQPHGTLEVAQQVAAEWDPSEHPEVWMRRDGAWSAAVSCP